MDQKEREFAEAKFGRNGLGYSEKEVIKGLRENLKHSNIHSVSQGLREGDASRYVNMPVIGDDKDPLFNEKLDDRISALYESLQLRLPEIIALNEKRKSPKQRRKKQKMKDTATTEPVLHEAGAMQGITNTLYGIEYDLSHWNDLPGASASERTRYVFARDSRIRYLLYLLLPLMIVIIVASCINK